MQLFPVQATVVLLMDEEGRVCLARKKQAIHHDEKQGGEDISYSLGLYNGYGGKREPLDPSIVHTALCELAGEARIMADASDLEFVSKTYFWKLSNATSEMMPFMEVFFFVLRRWYGVPQEGKEMGPAEWFFPEDIPYENMMPADEDIFKSIFAGERNVFEIKLRGKGEAADIDVLDDVLPALEFS